MIQKSNPILEEATRKNRGVCAFTATNFEILTAIIADKKKCFFDITIIQVSTSSLLGSVLPLILAEQGLLLNRND